MSSLNDVLTVLQVKLAKISTANGFHTDAGAEIYRGRETLGEHDPVPALSVFYEGEKASRPLVNCLRHHIDGSFVVVGFVEVDPRDPMRCPLELLDDIKRALFSSSSYSEWHPIVQDVHYDQSGVLYRDEGGTLGQVAVMLTIQWQEAIQ